MKNTLITIIVLAILGVGIYFFIIKAPTAVVENPNVTDTSMKDTTTNATSTLQDDVEKTDTSTTTPMATEKETNIGTSVDGNDITAYHFGNGNTELLFVGGIHGGYAWNTVLLGYELVDYLEANPDTIPENIKITVIPVLNPDGLNETVGSTGRFTIDMAPTSLNTTIPGRFNANEVDLNRNFNCDWQSEAVWQDKTVSGGSEPFSEPESVAIKNYIETNNPQAVVVWYSSADGVFSSSCHNGPSDEILAITNVYADASGYKAYEDFDFYKITGDMVNWIAKNDIPAISVLLATHNEVEWEKNKAGIIALLEYYSE